MQRYIGIDTDIDICYIYMYIETPDSGALITRTAIKGKLNLWKLPAGVQESSKD